MVEGGRGVLGCVAAVAAEGWRGGAGRAAGDGPGIGEVRFAAVVGVAAKNAQAGRGAGDEGWELALAALTTVGGCRYRLRTL